MNRYRIETPPYGKGSAVLSDDGDLCKCADVPSITSRSDGVWLEGVRYGTKQWCVNLSIVADRLRECHCGDCGLTEIVEAFRGHNKPLDADGKNTPQVS